MDFTGTGKRLTDLDLPRIGARIGVGEDPLHAFLDVETRGGGFDSRNRLKALFEPHVFYRELKRSGTAAQLDEAVEKGLAYRRWGEQKYPSESYSRINAAMLIDANAALRSTSWGLGQTIGFNCAMVGYNTALDMVKAFLTGEAAQLDAVVEFLVSASLDDEMRALDALRRPATPDDCRALARGYNGAEYAKHDYHVKLARAFNKWRSIPDTPFEIDRAPVDPNEAAETGPKVVVVSDHPTIGIGHKGPDVEYLQRALARLRYFAGRFDGDFGALTRAALLAFQADNGLDTDGWAGAETWAALKTAEPKPERDVEIEDLHESGTLKDLDAVDRTADVGALYGVIATWQMATGLAADARVQIDQASGALETITAAVSSYWPALAAIAVVVVIYALVRGTTVGTRLKRLTDAREGRHVGR